MKRTIEQIKNDLLSAISYNRQLGGLFLTRKKFPSYCKILSKHGNRALISVDNVAYRVKFRDAIVSRNPEPRWENDFNLTYKNDLLVEQLPDKKAVKQTEKDDIQCI